jgi:hypothetical protein
MSSMPRSILDYHERVRRGTNKLRDSWLRKLKARLEAEASDGEERDYWQTLIMMARLDWAANDLQVRAALDSGLERYRDELSDRDAPPSATYMVDYVDGRFVHRLLEGGNSPFALLRKHIELIDRKLTVLILINQFVAVTQQHRVVSSEQSEPNTTPTSLIKNLTTLKTQLNDLLGSLNRVGVDLQRAKQRPSSDPIWSFEALNNLALALRDHEASRLMRQRVDHARATRTQLDRYREQIFRVEQDDSLQVVQDALNALTELSRLDRGNDYRVLTPPPDVVNYNSVILLGWQRQKLSVSSVDDIREPLEAIHREQRLIQEARSWFVREMQRLGLEKLIVNDDLWRSVASATSEDQKVLALWDWVIDLGNTHQRDRFLEGPLLLLEQARCAGLFVTGSQNSVSYLVNFFLTDVTDRGQIPTDGIKSAGEYIRVWQTHAQQHEQVPLSLLQHYAEKLLDHPGIKDSLARLKDPTRMWSSQHTLSQWSAMWLAEIAQIKRRLDIIVEWLRDYQNYSEFWQNELVRLQRSIDQSAQEKARTALRGELLNIAPDYPRYRGMDYRAGRPRLPRRGR